MRLHYTTTGNPQKPPVVLIHGLFGNGNNLMALARHLEDSHHIILPDQRNHGRSPWHDHMNYPAMADDIAELLNLMHIDQAVLVGHSMGGKTAMNFALRYPHRVSKLVALDIAPVTYRPAGNMELLNKMQELELEQVKTLQQAKLEFMVDDEATKLFLLQNLVRDGGKFRWRLNLAAIKAAIPTIAAFPKHSKGSTTTTLFVHGTTSDYLLPKHHQAIGRIFPKHSVMPLPEASHWLHAEQPEATAAIISGFITK